MTRIKTECVFVGLTVVEFGRQGELKSDGAGGAVTEITLSLRRHSPNQLTNQWKNSFDQSIITSFVP